MIVLARRQLGSDGGEYFSSLLNDQAQFVLKTETSYPYLQAKIQSLEKEETEIDVGEEEKAISAAYKLIHTLIDQGVKEAASKVDPSKAKAASKKWLESVRDKLLGLKVISITLDNQDDAYLIFETLKATLNKPSKISAQTWMTQFFGLLCLSRGPFGQFAGR